MGKLHSVTVHYDDGTTEPTNCNGALTEEEVKRYWVGHTFNHGERFEGDPARLVKAINVTFDEPLITCPHCGMGQFNKELTAHEVRADGKCNVCGNPLD